MIYQGGTCKGTDVNKALRLIVREKSLKITGREFFSMEGLAVSQSDHKECGGLGIDPPHTNFILQK